MTLPLDPETAETAPRPDASIPTITRSGLGERTGSPVSGRLPPEAREGIKRAWLEILKQRHPAVTWIAEDPSPDEAVASELAA